MRYRLYQFFLLISILTGLSVTGFCQNSGQKIRVACIGDSVTKGLGLKNQSQCYPAQLQALLGSAYLVENFGLNGATLLRKGHRPYVLSEEYQRALAYRPQLVIIHLGLNDTDPRNWPNFRDEFLTDYLELIRSFQNAAGPSTKIFICRMSPIFNAHPRFKSGTRDWFWQIQQQIEQVAKASDAELIDLHTPLYSHPELFKDALHPDRQGAGIIAQAVYQHITGDFGGLTLAPVFMDHMVVQQKAAIRIWGKANKQQKVMVRFHHQEREVVADQSGNWQVELEPLKAGGPYTLEVTSPGQQPIVIKDILVGEVWICAGQSNMEFQLKEAEKSTSDISGASNNSIRLFNMKGIVRPDATQWDSLALDRINKGAFMEGTWQSCDPENAAGFSAIGYYFGKMLHERLQVPVGLIQVSVGGAPIEAFIDRKTLEFDPSLVDVLFNWKQNDFIMDWCRERAALNMSSGKNELQRHPFEPAYIYETAIQPMASFNVSGVIWYQGESNAHNAEHYLHAFPALVSSWRRTFKNPEMPFYFAQLSSISRPSWPFFRETQRQLSHSVAHCAMVVTSDLGDSLNVHPTRKRPVGERFAQLALANVYQQKIACSGPEPKGFHQKGERLILSFENASSLKTADGLPVREFEIAGQDGVFVPAKAAIHGNEIVIQTGIQQVQKIRYGWNPFSRANMVNQAGWPASTFEIEKK